MGILDTLAPATCSSCRYWEILHGPSGDCHRHAPNGYFCTDTGVTFGVWPRTDACDTCGDWERRLEAIQP